MEYLALLYGDGETWERATEEERTKVYARYTEFADAAVAAGVLIDGAELGSATSTTTVRIRDGVELVTDGPYAEAKEALGGYFILDCESFDAALDWAARIPTAERGAVEVRPVHVEPEA